MDVRVCGPNLRDQSKGQFHIHRHDCGDLKHYGPGGKYGGDMDGPNEMLVKNATVRDVVMAVYDNGILDEALADYGESGETKEDIADSNLYVGDFWFAPCCEGLPRNNLAEYELFSHSVGDEISTEWLQRIVAAGFTHFRLVDTGNDMYDYLCAKDNSINEMEQEEADELACKVYEELTS